MRRLGIALLAALLLAPAVPAAARAVEPGEPAEREAPPAVVTDLADRYFIGYETEPAMDALGRTMASTHAAVSRFAGTILPSRRFAPLYELPLGLVLSTITHEQAGHGGRAREYGLDPTYTFASTSINKDPETNLQLIMVGTGGTESSSVMAQRILQELHRGDGADGSKIALLLWAKTDLSLYVALTPDPGDSPADFQDEYEGGNDIAFTIAARQAHRRGADPRAVWNGDYRVDFTDPLLAEVYDDVRAAAIWNLLDPAFFSALASYAWDYAAQGRVRVRPRVLELGSSGWGITAGTRAFLGPDDVSRYLDLLVVTPGPLLRFSGRDISSSTERGYGGGAAIVGLEVAPGLEASLGGDAWRNPGSAEGISEGTGWNLAGEIEYLHRGRLGLSVKIGAKSDGYFPGAPMDGGAYAGAGILFSY
jgi:hypothetical protein